jgi:hypothetical protein
MTNRVMQVEDIVAVVVRVHPENRVLARRGLMRCFLGWFSLVVLSSVAPTEAMAWQAFGGLDSDNTNLASYREDRYSNYCDAPDGNCNFDITHTLSGTLDIAALPPGATEYDIVGVVVACGLCKDGSCSREGVETASTLSWIDWPGGESNSLSFEHHYKIRGTTLPGTPNSETTINGPESFNSFYCGLWLQGEFSGGAGGVSVMPSETFDPGDRIRRFAFAESGLVAELTGPLR